MQYVVGKSGVLSLGRQGEHLARRLLFTEPADWERELGPGSVQALVQPPGGGAAYPVSLERTEEGWLWTVTGADTAAAGRGWCELRYLAEDTVVKSRTYGIYVAAALGSPPDGQPGPWQRYLDRVLEIGAAGPGRRGRAGRAEQSGASGNLEWRNDTCRKSISVKTRPPTW